MQHPPSFRRSHRLLSELAAIGFRQFNAAMAVAGASGTTLIEKGMATQSLCHSMRRRILACTD